MANRVTRQNKSSRRATSYRSTTPELGTHGYTANKLGQRNYKRQKQNDSMTRSHGRRRSA